LQSPPSGELATLTEVGAPSDLRIRYDAATGVYEVSEGSQWLGLRPSSHYSATPNHYFAYGPTDPASESFFQTYVVAADPAPDNYQYSSLAVWGKGAGAYYDKLNFTAFGIATGAASVPVAGSASYQGLIRGSSDVLEFDGLIGADVAATITGSVALNFNFAAGTLDGSIHPTLNTFGGAVDLGTLAFVDTIYSSGSPTFSGRFMSSASGTNSFDGRFTGPEAQELIGRWIFPFVYSGDGNTHSASGAWIAKR
jgi:hypothetical protein